LSTGDGRKLLVLDVEKLGKETAGSRYLSGFEIPITALWTLPVGVLHEIMV